MECADMQDAFEDGYERGYSEGYEVGFNAAIDKAVEVVESANNFLDALNQDEVWNISCRQADRKLRAVIEELNKLKENI